MWASFFVRQNDNIQPNRHNIIKDIIRLIRDALAITNDCFHLAIITTLVDYLNHSLGDTQDDDLRLNA